MGKTIKHNWTKETMDRCRKVFLDQLTNYHYNYADGDWKREKIASLIEQYFKIECDVRKNG